MDIGERAESPFPRDPDDDGGSQDSWAELCALPLTQECEDQEAALRRRKGATDSASSIATEPDPPLLPLPVVLPLLPQTPSKNRELGPRRDSNRTLVGSPMLDDEKRAERARRIEMALSGGTPPKTMYTRDGRTTPTPSKPKPKPKAPVSAPAPVPPKRPAPPASPLAERAPKKQRATTAVPSGAGTSASASSNFAAARGRAQVFDVDVDDEVQEIPPPTTTGKRKAGDDAGPKGKKAKQDGNGTAKGKTKGKPTSTSAGKLDNWVTIKRPSPDKTVPQEPEAEKEREPEIPSSSPATGAAVTFGTSSTVRIRSLRDWTVHNGFRVLPLAHARIILLTPRSCHERALADKPPAVQWAAARFAADVEKLNAARFAALEPHLKTNLEGVRALMNAIGRTDEVSALFTNEALEELDREMTERARDPAAGLGGNASRDGWYGGRVTFRLCTRYDDKAHTMIFTFDRVEVSTSCRLWRVYGSGNWITICIGRRSLRSARPPAGDETWDQYWCRPFVLFGHVFRIFHSKEQGRRFAIRTNQTTDPKIAAWPHTELLQYALDRHNPFALNSTQTIQKWNARFALGLSNSVPTVQFKPENIFQIEDTYANGKGFGEGMQEPKSYEIMTDGAGRMNLAGFRAVRERLGYDSLPVALQVRIAGAKGMVVIDRTDTSDEPKIWLRRSQIKIQYPPYAPGDDPLNDSRYILEVLRPARTMHPSRVSGQALVNLAENEIDGAGMKRVILKHSKTMLDELYTSFTTWATLEDRIKLAQVIDRNCSVNASWRAQAASGEARAKGLKRFDRERTTGSEELDDDDNDEVLDTRPPFETGIVEEDDRHDENEIDTESDSNPIDVEAPETDSAYSPEAYMSKGASAYTMLVAGIEPQTTPRLRALILDILKSTAMIQLRKFRIVVPHSAECFIIPDPIGVLQEGEIFFASSQTLNDAMDTQVNHIVGQVLVYRNPVRLATDLQKVKAVYYPELQHFRDVIIFSCKGNRSLASKLAGGDYDGDTAVLIWDSEIVDRFQNETKLVGMMNPDAGFAAKYFEQRTESMLEFLANTGLDVESLGRIMHAACDDKEKIGIYSAYHELAQYRLGYRAKLTIEFAWKFNTILDGAKSGDRIRDEWFQSDRSWFSNRIPLYKSKTCTRRCTGTVVIYHFDPDKDKTFSPSERDHQPPDDDSRRHILDMMWEEGIREVNDQTERLVKLVSDIKVAIDHSFEQPWVDFCRRIDEAPEVEASAMRQVQSVVREFCKDIFTRRRANWAKSTIARNQAASSVAIDNQQYQAAEKALKLASAVNQQLRSEFKSGPKISSSLYDNSTVRELTAACAFWLCHQPLGKDWIPDLEAKFAFDFAFDEACAIKTKTLPVQSRSVLQSFFIHMPVRIKNR